ncbi:MAG: alkaline phosphatase [Chloroflexi bacterium]|nr:alkaline phosphatase [Chloroflexota bacterium]
MNLLTKWGSLLCAAVLVAAVTISMEPSTPAMATSSASQLQVASTTDLSDSSLADVGKAKYTFLFIGDGMASAQRTAAELYLAATNGNGARPELTKLNMDKLPAQGMNTTYDLTSVVPDSASTATAISTGFKTASGVVGMDPTGTQKYPTVAEVAKTKGLKVGIVSAVSLDHATPAAFYAHQPSRNNYSTFFDKIQHQKASYLGFNQKLQQYKRDHTAENASFEEVLPLIQDSFGLTVLPADDRAQLEQRAKEKDPDAIGQLGMALTDQEVTLLKEALAESMKDPKARAKNDYTYSLDW